jgi:hypothetical protein
MVPADVFNSALICMYLAPATSIFRIFKRIESIRISCGVSRLARRLAASEDVSAFEISSHRPTIRARIFWSERNAWFLVFDINANISQQEFIINQFMSNV